MGPSHSECLPSNESSLRSGFDVCVGCQVLGHSEDPYSRAQIKALIRMGGVPGQRYHRLVTLLRLLHDFAYRRAKLATKVMVCTRGSRMLSPL